MYQRYMGDLFSEISDVISDVTTAATLTDADVTAINNANSYPTLANIQTVKDTFAAEGKTPPVNLINLLNERYASAVANNPSAYGGSIMTALTEYLPYILLGVGAIWFLKRR
jgi:hypothetical protein